ncbi:MAG: UDP-N-acetylmuramate dehydrogenase [Patescibacteria group bacterium]|nr:UDP-N-acetylmuramate dehydrogenase [Patescibacteria group bacterium]
MDELYKKLKEYGRVRVNEPMARHTNFKIGGPAAFFVEAKETEKIVGLLNFLRGEGQEFFVLGGGTNVLFSDFGYEGTVVKIQNEKYKVSDEKIEADAGVLLRTIVETAAENELTGMEWAAGIPGSVGGAARGNAGAMGFDIAGCVEKVEVWRDGEVLNLRREDCEFGYRDSGFKHGGGVILRVVFKFRRGDKKEILKTIHSYLEKRAKLPPEPSAGSFFKNIKLENWRGDKSELSPVFIERKMIPAGWLCENAGLKGMRAGGAAFSEKHGNFIINLGKATSEDVMKIVETAKERVYNKFGVELEPEVEIIK